jgi:hypothetical protein
MNIEFKMSLTEAAKVLGAWALEDLGLDTEKWQAKATVSGFSGITIEISQIKKTEDGDADS